MARLSWPTLLGCQKFLQWASRGGNIDIKKRVRVPEECTRTRRRNARGGDKMAKIFKILPRSVYCPNQDLHLFDWMSFPIILQSAEIRCHPVTVSSSRIWSVAYQRPFLQRLRYQENHAAFWSPTQTWIGQTPSQWAGFGKCSSKLVKRKWKTF